MFDYHNDALEHYGLLHISSMLLHNSGMLEMSFVAWYVEFTKVRDASITDQPVN